MSSPTCSRAKHGDFVPEAVAIVARELMEAEVSGERTTHRNGYRPQLWETRVGEVELAIPRKRAGSVLPHLPGAAPGWLAAASCPPSRSRERRSEPCSRPEAATVHPTSEGVTPLQPT